MIIPMMLSVNLIRIVLMKGGEQVNAVRTKDSVVE